MRLLRTASGSAHRPPFVPKMVRRCSATREYTASRDADRDGEEDGEESDDAEPRESAEDGGGFDVAAGASVDGLDDDDGAEILGHLSLAEEGPAGGALLGLEVHHAASVEARDETRVAAAQRAVPVDEGHQRRGVVERAADIPARAHEPRAADGVQGCARTRARPRCAGRREIRRRITR